MTQTKAELLQTRHQGDIRLGDADSTHYVGFKAPATVGTSLVWTLPSADGTAGYYLKTDGSGNLGWSVDNTGVTLSGSTNNTIATVTGANALQGEAKLTFDGNHVVQTISASGEGARFIAAGNHYPEIRLNANRTSAGNSVGHILGQWNSIDIAAISFIAGADTTNKDDGEIKFNTRLSGAGITERMRIDSSGKIGIGATAPEELLHIKDVTAPAIQLEATGGGPYKSLIKMGGNDMEIRGSSGNIEFFTGNADGDSSTERIRIDSSGRLLVGQTSGLSLYANGLFQVSATDGNAALAVNRWSNNSSSPYLNFGKSRSGTVGTYTIVQSGDRLGQINFTGADGTDLASPAAGIAAYVDGTPGSNDMPGRIVFFTTPDGSATETERFRISSTGVSKFTGGIAQVATAAGALDLDLNTSNYFTKTISGNSTFTFSNPAASGTVTAFTLELTHSSGTVTWPSSVKWNADTTPTLTTGKTHLFMFVTDDGGSRYRGSALVDYVN